MQTGLTLPQLATKINDLRSKKRDFIAPTRALTLSSNADISWLNIPDHLGVGVNDLAHGQIATYTGIPQAYYDRLRKEQPELLDRNVNTWFASNDEKRLVRTIDGRARAFLSNRYQRIENEEIAEVALPILLQTPGINVVSCEVTDRRMYIQATTDRIAGDVKKGDTVQAGVVISNSEVGFGAVSVAAMTYRLVCLNGMIAAEKFRAAHVGKAVDDNETLWADDTRKADDRAVLLKVRDMVKVALDEARFRARLEKLQALPSSEVKNPVVAVEVLGQKLGATQEETGGILNALIKGGDLSTWGVLNAVTAQAHTAKTYDRAVEFEALGGQLLELSRDAWHEVLDAETAPVRRRKELVAA